MLSNGVLSEEDKILNMPILRVYSAIQLKAWLGDAEKRYSRALSRKK